MQGFYTFNYNHKVKREIKVTRVVSTKSGKIYNIAYFVTVKNS